MRGRTESLHRKRERTGENPWPAPGIRVWAGQQQKGANRWWSPCFTKSPSWRSTAFVRKWQSITQGRALSLILGGGCRPASTHLSFIFRAQHIGETRGCSDICRAGWLGVTERWHSWPSLQCYPHGHQEHGWWKGTILKWLSGQQISMGKAVRAREEDIMNAPQ